VKLFRKPGCLRATSRKGPSQRHSERGSLLLDYFLAASLFSVTFGAFLTAITARVRGLGMAERMVHATQAAESQLAELRAGASVNKSFQVPNVPNAKGLIMIETSEEPQSSLHPCAVIVEWTEPDGTRQKVRLDSIVRKGAK
jgi:hypothetical protein